MFPICAHAQYGNSYGYSRPAASSAEYQARLEQLKSEHEARLYYLQNELRRVKDELERQERSETSSGVEIMYIMELHKLIHNYERQIQDEHERYQKELSKLTGQPTPRERAVENWLRYFGY